MLTNRIIASVVDNFRGKNLLIMDAMLAIFETSYGDC